MATVTQQLIVNNPAQTINVVLTLTSTITINVKDPLGTVIQGASVSIGTLPPVETDVTGTSVIMNVPYGTQTLTVSK